MTTPIMPADGPGIRSELDGYIDLLFGLKIHKLTCQNNMSRSPSNYCLSKLGRDHGSPDNLWVITCYFNPCQYQNRYHNYIKFAQGLQKQKVNLLTVELGERSTLPTALATKHIALIESDVLWAKERLLQIALDALPITCRYVVWCDCDILFGDSDWAWQTVQALQTYRVIQPFSKCFFLGALETPQKHGMFSPSLSFARWYQRRARTVTHTEHVLGEGHPGYVWAARRDVLQRIGFYDKCILGHADVVMAVAFSHCESRDGLFPLSWEPHWTPGWSVALQQDVRAWQAKAAEVVQGDLGFLPGNIFHLWHGPRSNRNYGNRGYLLQDFDPAQHLMLSPVQTWRWTPAAKEAQVDQRCLLYFQQRQEDDRRLK